MGWGRLFCFLLPVSWSELVGPARFELATYCSQSSRASQAALRPDGPTITLPARDCDGVADHLGTATGCPSDLAQRIAALNFGDWAGSSSPNWSSPQLPHL